LFVLAPHQDDPTNQIFAFFCPDETIGVSPIREYIQKMEGQKVKRAILVVQAGITPYAKAVLLGMAPKRIMEQFREQELLVNITDHVLVPRHQVRSKHACRFCQSLLMPLPLPLSHSFLLSHPPSPFPYTRC
jgi:DNA-directed RNA polymerase I, II, and III subunit RPABC1